MQIVRMNGGLGNQVFQYIFARYLEEATGSRVIIDDSHFFYVHDKVLKNREERPGNNTSGAHNGYELEYVFPEAAKPILLSQYFEEDVWEYMVSQMMISKTPEISMAQQLYDNGVDDQTAIFEAAPQHVSDAYTGKKFYSTANCYNSILARLTGNVYFYGYWINPGWFNAYKEVMLKDLSFRPITDPVNKQYEKDIEKSLSIGVHIRRGDFVTLEWALTEDYYHTVLSKLQIKYPGARYFIFSDQIEWCKENAEKLGIPKSNAEFVCGNFDYENNYIDMKLMAMCSVLVVGVSAFSYLASILNQRKGFTAIQVRNPPVEDIGLGYI